MKSSKIISWTAVLGWMGLIFRFSHQPATVSSKLSGGIVSFITDIIVKVFNISELSYDLLHTLVRKTAHFTIYAILGILVFNALCQSEQFLRVRWKHFFGKAFFICFLYAISDEIHQLFISGRSGEIRDVLIDSSGVLIGISSYYVFVLKRKLHWY